jgi:hypothetical protein
MSEGEFEVGLFDLYGEAQAGSSDAVTERTLERVRMRDRMDGALRLAAGLACVAAAAATGVAAWPAIRRATEGDFVAVLPLAMLGLAAFWLGAVRLARGL